MKKKFVFTFLFAGFMSVAMAQPGGQDKTQLEKERQQIQKELKEMQSAYDKLKGQSKQILAQKTILERKMNLQEQYIGSINKEIQSITDDIYLSELEIYRLSKQLDTLKSEYARSVVYAYKNRSNYDYLNFVFSANNFNDALKRISYLKNYKEYREKQVSTIKETQQLIAQRKQQQLGRKEQKNEALVNQTKQVKELENQKKEKEVVMSQLKSKEKDLAKQIAAKKKRDAKLKSAIFAIIERERIKAIETEKKRLAALEAERIKNATKTEKTNTPDISNTKPVVVTKTKERTANSPKTYVPLNVEETNLAASFKANYGRLPWPVDNGVVCHNFGPQKIEGTLLTENNDGITICTSSAGIPVKAVFSGEVLSVFNMEDSWAVMLKHGNYFTIYSNLGSVSVSKGSMVTTSQVIGKVGKSEEGGGEIDLILMIDKKNVNPRSWLR